MICERQGKNLYLLLKEEAIEILDDFIRSNPDSRELKRALAVKYVKPGKSYREIRQLLGVCLGYISKWLHSYEVEGTVGLGWRCLPIEAKLLCSLQSSWYPLEEKPEAESQARPSPGSS